MERVLRGNRERLDQPLEHDLLKHKANTKVLAGRGYVSVTYQLHVNDRMLKHKANTKVLAGRGGDGGCGGGFVKEEQV